jgi:hypothetical protein
VIDIGGVARMAVGDCLSGLIDRFEAGEVGLGGRTKGTGNSAQSPITDTGGQTVHVVSNTRCKFIEVADDKTLSAIDRSSVLDQVTAKFR